MSLSRSRRAALVAALALPLPALALIAAPGAPARAAEATGTIAFDDCEVFEMPYGINRRILDDVAWTTQVMLEAPTPVPAREDVTVAADIGALPAGLVPQQLSDVEVNLYLGFTSPLGADIAMVLYDYYLGDYGPGDAVDIDDFENLDFWPDAGVFDYRVKSVEAIITGYAGEEFAEYRFICDQIVNPTTLLTVSAYDLSATPEIVSNEYSVRQGATIQVSGRNLLTTAPTEPPANVTVTIGGIEAGTYPLDPSGGFVADVRVPDFVTPGAGVTIRAANGAKVATTQIQVTAGKAKIKATPKAVKSGKKVKVTGAGFKPGEKVTLTLKGGKGKGSKSAKASVKAKADGTISKAVKLKKAAKGTWKVIAKGGASKRAGKASFKVT